MKRKRLNFHTIIAKVAKQMTNTWYCFFLFFFLRNIYTVLARLCRLREFILSFNTELINSCSRLRQHEAATTVSGSGTINPSERCRGSGLQAHRRAKLRTQTFFFWFRSRDCRFSSQATYPGNLHPHTHMHVRILQRHACSRIPKISAAQGDRRMHLLKCLFNKSPSALQR